MLIDGINSGTIDYVDGSVEAADMASGVLKGKNKIINGNFDIWQRGTSFSHAQTQYSADRWRAYTGASNHNVTRMAFAAGQTDVPNEPTYYLNITSTIVFSFQQSIEDVRTFAGKNCTLSYYAKIGTGTRELTPKLNQYFGSGGSTAVNTLAPSPITLTTSWQKFEITFALPSISGKTIGANNYLAVNMLGSAASANDSIDFAQVQLEEGSVATEFEQRHIGEELALCQRYWCQSYTTGTSAGTVSSQGAIYVRASSTSSCLIPIFFPAQMRSLPTMKYYGTNANNNNNAEGNWRTNSDVAVSIATSQFGTKNIVATGSTSDNYVLQGHYTADAEL